MMKLQPLPQRLVSSWTAILDPVKRMHPSVQQQMRADTLMNGAAPDPERHQEIIAHVATNLRPLHGNGFHCGSSAVVFLIRKARKY